MLTLTSPFYLLAVIAPFIPKVLARGSQAYEQSLPSPSPAPVVANGHPTTMASPRKPMVPVPELRLVRDCTDASSQPSARVTNRSVTRPLPSASTRAFVKWLRDNNETEELSQRTLLALYSEYCDYADRAPVTTRQLFNKIKSCGVDTYRPAAKVVNGKLHRPTIYKVRVQQRRAA